MLQKENNLNKGEERAVDVGNMEAARFGVGAVAAASSPPAHFLAGSTPPNFTTGVPSPPPDFATGSQSPPAVDLTADLLVDLTVPPPVVDLIANAPSSPVHYDTKPLLADVPNYEPNNMMYKVSAMS